MALKHRLARLEKTLGLGPAAKCPICHDSAIRGICIYFEEEDGTLRLQSGTPPEPCPACGKLPKRDGVSDIIYGSAKVDRPFDEPFVELQVSQDHDS
jgi:hypothetical protein